MNPVPPFVLSVAKRQRSEVEGPRLCRRRDLSAFPLRLEDDLAPDNTSTTRIALVTPAGPTRRTGNRISGGRWARILRASGYRVKALDRYERERCDLLIALHARRSHGSVRRFRELHPGKPVVVVLTGTDLYNDIHVDENARESLRLADRLVLLQRKGLDELDPSLHEKTRVIYQSAEPRPGGPGDPKRRFIVATVGHMRPEKDPFRTAMAVRALPASSRIRVVHIGAAFEESLARRARQEMERNPRYRWMGEWPHWKTRQFMARSHLVSITSRMEGSSNVLCEALASGVPVAASRISGLIGTLGDDYPGYYELGDTAGLKRVLLRAENDLPFYESLAQHCAEVAPLVNPDREIHTWQELIRDVMVECP